MPLHLEVPKQPLDGFRSDQSPVMMAKAYSQVPVFGFFHGATIPQCRMVRVQQ
jgi:hypothetical protein